METKSEKLLNIVLPLITIGVILGLWAICSASINSELILPSIGQTVKQAVGLFKSKDFYVALSLTLLRSVIAFAISFALAFITGYVSKKSKNVKKILAPVISIVRALPTIAVVLLLLFWTNSQIAPIVVTMLVIFPTLYNHIIDALDKVDYSAVEACEIFGVSKKEIFFKVKVRQSLPSLLVAIGSGLSLNIKLMVAAEVLAQTSRSMGYLLNTAKVYFEIANMIALVLITVIIGVLIEFIFRLISKKVGKWQ